MLVLPPRIVASVWLATSALLASEPTPIPNGIDTNTAVVGTGTSTAFIASASNTLKTQTYDLGNGSVTLSNPLEISVSKNSAKEGRKNYNQSELIRLRDPTLLGSGGGGAVFGYIRDGSSSSLPDVAVKISWSGSAKSVRNECHVLQVLEERGVSTGVEKCLTSLDYPFGDSNRAMIAMEPVVVGKSVSNIADLPTPALRETAVDQLMRIMLQMMAAGVVTTDVQPLISTETGSVLLIDMTEAQEISSTPTFVDLALATSFTSEIWNLVPEDLVQLASNSLLSEWKLLEKSNDRHQWSASIVQILKDQPLLSEVAADYIGEYSDGRK
ncbi:unnamed protein product [Cylindrotheca closterium]|uniref:Protein kinase domain-containing protein n=1 Tax=Cylindrotheca closterium TaxID=2856 RepID=A0AAD2CYK3_9STRA|nr:unnamed protein product [Cylindrotheca closterium]